MLVVFFDQLENGPSVNHQTPFEAAILGFKRFHSAALIQAGWDLVLLGQKYAKPDGFIQLDNMHFSVNLNFQSGEPYLLLNEM